MKTFSVKSILIAFLMAIAVSSLFAQGGPPPGPPPGGGRPGGFDPDEMIKREKQNVFKAIADLSDDQKLLLDGIYDEFSQSFKEIRDEMRQTRNFQEMRPKMQALRTEKDGLIKDVLNEEQFAIYTDLMENRRRQMQEMRQRQGGNGNPPSDIPPQQEPNP